MRHTLCSLIFVLGATALAAQGAERAAFIVRLGTDTVAAELLTRTAERLEGRCIGRTPRTAVRDYTGVIDANGAVHRFEIRTAGAPDVSTLDFTGDKAGAIPFVANCWGLLELATRRFATGRDATLKQTGIPPGDNPESRTITVERRGADSVTVTVIEGVPYRVAVDGQGRVRGAAWAGHWSVERLPSLDIDALARAFRARPLGPLSPGDSVSATVADATVSVKYSRPARRGRTIFGDVVPWNEVWRTGANEATLLTTTADLQMGGATIPAGRYTIWTLPARTGWKLIINENTGQWGTDYAERYDLVRLDMHVDRLAAPVERFTIGIEPRGEGAGVLTLEWETTRAWIEFRPKHAVGN